MRYASILFIIAVLFMYFDDFSKAGAILFSIAFIYFMYHLIKEDTDQWND